MVTFKNKDKLFIEVMVIDKLGKGNRQIEKLLLSYRPQQTKNVSPLSECVIKKSNKNIRHNEEQSRFICIEMGNPTHAEFV